MQAVGRARCVCVQRGAGRRQVNIKFWIDSRRGAVERRLRRGERRHGKRGCQVLGRRGRPSQPTLASRGGAVSGLLLSTMGGGAGEGRRAGRSGAGLAAAATAAAGGLDGGHEAVEAQRLAVQLGLVLYSSGGRRYRETEGAQSSCERLEGWLDRLTRVRLPRRLPLTCATCATRARPLMWASFMMLTASSTVVPSTTCGTAKSEWRTSAGCGQGRAGRCARPMQRQPRQLQRLRPASQPKAAPTFMRTCTTYSRRL